MQVLRIALLATCSATILLFALTGSAVAQGVTGYQEVTQTTAIPFPTTVTASVSCPTGTVVVGGGYEVPDPSGMHVETSAPSSGAGVSSTTWTVTVQDTDKTSETVTVTAVCVDGTIPGYFEAQVTPSVSPQPLASESAQCPVGDVVVGGGFSNPAGVPEDSSLPETSSNIVNDVWTSEMDTSNQTGNVTVGVTAICVASNITGYAEPTTNMTVVGGVSTVSQSCSSGEVVLGGGVSGIASTVESDQPSVGGAVSNHTWATIVNTPFGATQVVTVTAICASLAPTVTNVSPTSGPGGGGTSVTITGTNLSGATGVSFGATTASSFAVNSATQITATAPAGSGTVDITVTTPGGTSATGPGDQYSYIPPPTVTGLSPASGRTAGGTKVTITGTNLSGATSVKFGATAASSFTVTSATQITATSPAGSAGAVDVTVTTVGGTSATVAADKFTYVALPTVTGVSPTSGVTTGGTSVTITGTNLTGASAVKFGSTAASSFTVSSATRITAISPAGSGTVHVTVTTVGGTSATSAADQFSYDGPPTVTRVSPSSGPATGGTTVTIAGAVLSTVNAVKFGTTPATSFMVNGPTQVTATAPPGTAGTVDVTVTTQYGTSATGSADKFTYVAAPTVTGVSPSGGPTTGATSVTITGANLSAASAVGFGSTPAASFTVNSATQITASSPVGSGTVDVTVTTLGGTSATSPADHFVYLAPSGPSSVTLAPPIVVPAEPSVVGTAGAQLSASINPNGSPTTVYFEYGLDPKYGLSTGSAVYTARTPDQTIGSGSTAEPVTALVTNLVPDATYDARAVATNSAGTVTGANTPFKTAALPPPPPPVIGKSANFAVVSGTVYVKYPGSSTTRRIAGFNSALAAPRAIAALTKGVGFVPLTEARQLPVGTQVDARAGTLRLVTATTAKTKRKRAQTQTGDFAGGLFAVLQSDRRGQKGLTTMSLLDSGLFPGAPSYSSCVAVGKTGRALATAAKAKPLSNKVLQTLNANEHGNFATKGKYSSATVRGTQFSVSDRCDGTLTVVKRGTVVVTNDRTRKNITLHSHQSYLAKAP